MSTRGTVDIVFCLDASASMRPCIDAVRRHVGAFLESLHKHSQQKVDCRLDFLAYACDETQGVYRLQSMNLAGTGLVGALYGSPSPAQFFTTDVAHLQRKLDAVEVEGDEATFVAIDTALDFPWRPRAKCHRVLVVLTDEPFETNAHVPTQKAKLSELIDKVHDLGVMLFLVAPASAGYRELAEADRSEYKEVDGAGSGLARLDFAKIMEFIGKSVSMARAGGEEKPPRRALFGQAGWVGTNADISGR